MPVFNQDPLLKLLRLKKKKVERWKPSNIKDHIDLPYCKDDNLMVLLASHTSEQDIYSLTACRAGWRAAMLILFLLLHH